MHDGHLPGAVITTTFAQNTTQHIRSLDLFLRSIFTHAQDFVIVRGRICVLHTCWQTDAPTLTHLRLRSACSSWFCWRRKCELIVSLQCKEWLEFQVKV